MIGEKSGASNFQTQGIAYSTDKGRTWIKYTFNPVIKNTGNKDFRDPKLIWHGASKAWIVTLAVGNQVFFYRSRNLKQWEYAGSFGKEEGSHGGVWECPDLIEIKATKSQPAKWLLLVSVGTGAPNGGSGTQYFIGNFDGKTFQNELPKNKGLWVDWGTDNYAGVTWSHAPGKLPIFLGWMSNWQYAQQVPTKTWRSAMTLPRSLSLQKTTAGWRLFSNPIEATQQLRNKEEPINLLNVQEPAISLNELIVSFDVSKENKEDPKIELVNQLGEKLVMGYNRLTEELYVDRTLAGKNDFSKVFSGKHTAKRIIKNKLLTMHIFIDQASVEMFADKGSVVITDLFFPTVYFNKVHYTKTNMVSGKLYNLHSIW